MLCIKSDVYEGLMGGFIFGSPWGSRRGWRTQAVWASWVSLPGRQAGCGLKRMWEFFDFEISREERQTFWECLCDGGPVEMLAKQWIGLHRVFSDTQHLCREMWNGKKRICERGGVVTENLGKKNR